LRIATASEQIVASVDVSGWSGSDRFASVTTALNLRSTRQHRGRVYIARVGGGGVTSLTPADIWLAGDTGRARPVLLRAHPVIENGELLIDQMGRRIGHVSGEVQQWWNVASPLRLSAAAFVDAAA
jgi:hypothetical protein